MIEDIDTAKEILEYCYTYLIDDKKIKDFKKTNLYKDMVKEIEFMMTTD